MTYPPVYSDGGAAALALRSKLGACAYPNLALLNVAGRERPSSGAWITGYLHRSGGLPNKPKGE